jgi:DNA primase
MAGKLFILTIFQQYTKFKAKYSILRDTISLKMNDQVEEIKTKTDIVAVVGERIQLKKAGSNYKANCPFHGEKTPSFMVSPELQIFKCFGCQKSGDVFTFLMEYEGMEFYEALKFLAEKAGVKLKVVESSQKSLNQRLMEVNSYVSVFYHYCLTKHPSGKEALNYFTQERGLTLNTIETFQLGFSPDHPLALRKYVVDRKKVSEKELSAVGVTYNRGSGSFDRFRGRVIFPLFDHRGNIVGFAGRVLPGEKNKDLAKYINTPETPIYHKSKILYGLEQTRSEIKRMGFVVVVEGEIDLMSSWQAGIKNIVAIKGSALTDEQVKLLSRFCKTIVLALDADFAGNEAARRGIVIAEKEGLNVKVAKIVGYKDPDDVARHEPEKLRKFIDEAVGAWDFIIDSVFTKFSGDTGEEKSKISKELVPIVASMTDKIVQAHFADLIARRLNVPVEAVMEEVKNAARITLPSAKVSTSLSEEIKTRAEILEERLLSIAFRLDPFCLKEKEYSNLIKTSFAKKMVEEISKIPNSKNFKISEFSTHLPKELQERFSDLILKEVEGLEFEKTSEEDLQKELELVVKSLTVLEIKDELARLTSEMQKFETSNEKDKLKEAEESYTKLSRKL